MVGIQGSIMAKDLRRIADELEQKIAKAERDSRRAARSMVIGRAMASGVIPIPLQALDQIRIVLQKKGTEAGQMDLRLVSEGVLVQQGYYVRDGDMHGPRSCPTGAPPRFGFSDDVAAVPGGGSGSGSAPPVISIGEARQGLKIKKKHAAWGEGLREFDTWVRAQERRAWVFGEILGEWVLGLPHLWRIVQTAVLAGDARTAVLAGDRDRGKVDEVMPVWTDESLRIDYSAAELGENLPPA